MEDKKKSSKIKVGKTPHYNAQGIKAPRSTIKGIGKSGLSLGGLKGAQVAPAPGQGSEAFIAKSVGKCLISNLSRKPGRGRS